MKRDYYRIRIMLRTFGLGLAAVCMWQGFSLSWWDVPVDLPEARSGNLLEITVPLGKQQLWPKYLCDEVADQNDRAACLHQVIFEGRDISLYDDGGRHGCGLERGEANTLQCERSMERARHFVWEHWKKRKRGYVAVVNASDKAEWTTHLFIEPKPDGTWRVHVPMLRKTDSVEPELGEVVKIAWYRANADDKNYGLIPNVLYLKLSNITDDYLLL